MKRIVFALLIVLCIPVAQGFPPSLVASADRRSLDVGGSPVLAQTQNQPIFRSGTRLIVENVIVKDKSGNSVEGLTAKDFTVTEDGEPQAITFVEYQRLATADAAVGRDFSRAADEAQLKLRPTDTNPPSHQR